jgi:hypothetical protein
MAEFTRREVVLAATGGLAASMVGVRAQAFTLPGETRAAMVESALVYISPLKSNAEESRCHGEVWYYADGDDVLVGSNVSTWKLRAVEKGLTQARVWVADYGPVWRAFGRYRSAPTFLARVSIDDSPAAFEKLMQGHARRYPDEWGAWEERFRAEYQGGSRKILRYSPVGP